MVMGYAMRTLLLVAAVWLAGCAAGQDAPPGAIDLSSPSGVIEVVPARGDAGAVLQIGNQRFLEDAGFRYIDVMHQFGPRYLVGVTTTDPSCFLQFIWIETRGSVRMTEPFGNCGRAFQFGLDADMPTVVLPDGRGGFDGFVYDGRTVDRVALGASPSGVGADPEDWVGQTLGDFVRAPEFQQLFLLIMPIEDYLSLGNRIYADQIVSRDGDWFGASACFFANCQIDLNGVYIHRSGAGLIALVGGAPVFDGTLWWDDGGFAPPQSLAQYAP